MMSDFEMRFGGIGRLFSAAGLERLRAARVCVAGVGGVGSWAVEALARSGVGSLTLVDLDEVCVSNMNRQLPALTSDVGKPKVEVMARRVREIQPECEVRALTEFFTEATAAEILDRQFDYLLDAIDNVPNKCLLIASCRQRGIPVLTVGGAGGRQDPTAVLTGDLAESTHDRLLLQVRKKLRADFGFPRQGRFEVACVFSREPVVYPWSTGAICGEREPGAALRLDCSSGYGTASFVTGAFGFAAAGHIVASLTKAA